MKSDTNSLTLAGDWIGGIVPGALDIASFTSTVSAANLGNLSLAADATWQGLALGVSTGPMVLNSTHTLTLGTGGINLAAATNSASILGGTLDLSGGAPLLTVHDVPSAPVDLAISSAIRNGAITITGDAAAPGSVTMLSGASSYTGRTTIRNGTLRAGASTTVFGIGSAVTVGGDPSRGALLDLDGYDVAIGSLTLGVRGSSAVSNVQTGTGTLTLGGDVFSLGFGSTSTTISGRLALGATRTISVVDAPGNSRDLVISAAISGAGAGLNKTLTGTLVLTGANTYSGATTLGSLSTGVPSGQVLVSGPAGTIRQSEATVIGAGAQLQLDYTGVAQGSVDRYGDTQALTLKLGGELYLQGAAAANSSETLGMLRLGSGKGIVTLNAPGSNSVTLTAASFDRGTERGTGLIRGTSLGQGLASSSALLLSSQTGLNLIGTGSATGATNLKIVPSLLGGNSATSPGTNFVTTGANGLRTLTVSEQPLITAGAAGDNVRTATGGNPITGAHVFNSLLIGLVNGSDTAATIGSTVRGDGASLTLTSGALAAVNLSGANNLSLFSSVIFGSAGANEAIVTTAGSSNLTLFTPINTASPGGGLTKAGIGNLVLAASNLYTGITVINEGTLFIGSETTGDLGANTAGIVVQRGATLAFARTDDTLSLPNVISGQGGVSQYSGTVSLTGVSTYTGPTTVFGGTLLISGSISGSIADVETDGILQLATGGLAGEVMVGQGGILRGTGQAGAVSIQTGGILAPGIGIGTLRTDTLSLTSDSIFELELGATTADAVSAAGAITLEGTIQLSITLTALPAASLTFTILNGTALLDGYSTGARFTYGGHALSEGDIFTVTSGGFTRDLAISYLADGGNDITLTVIPEPASVTAVLCGIGCLLSGRFPRRGAAFRPERPAPKPADISPRGA